MVELPEIIKKPLPCFQEWDEMIPVDGGRVCSSCSKLVSDFRCTTWAEISKIHKESPVPVCGLYSDVQLSTWGKEVSEKRFAYPKLLTSSLAVLSLLNFLPNSIIAQKPIQSKETNLSIPGTKERQIESKKVRRILKGIVLIHKTDSIKLPLRKAVITILEDSLKRKTLTDSLGRFQLVITKEFEKLPYTLTLIVSHPDYPIKTVKIDKNSLKPIEVSLMNIEVQENSVRSIETGVTYFYVSGPAPTINAPSNTDSLGSPKPKKKWWQWWRK